MNWMLHDKRNYNLIESSITARIGVCDAASDTPDEVYVEVFADDLSETVKISESTSLSPEEKQVFVVIWNKLRYEAMVHLGFKKTE